jgi:peptidoglycan/LPS O-acetylase OafA/YrhL
MRRGCTIEAGGSMQDGRGSSDSHQIGYRSDIDGLRAVAVLSVIAYHLSPKILPNGYLGVDIFFVLSGYLITKVIWREALNKTFTIARFYERRVRRILPALVVVLIVVSVCAIALLLPVDLTGFAKSVFASLGFVANIYFWRDTDYFAQLAEQKPLLHVWSLGVEEQFYIIFPLMVVLCIRWRRSALLPLTSVLVALSLFANIWLSRSSAEGAAFYLLPTRAWEIGAGALLALTPPFMVARSWLRHCLAFLAAVLLFTSLCFTGIPLGGLVPAALWVVLGTTLAIHLGDAGGNWLSLALSKSALVWVGLISYSLYLWHWPIFVFAHYYLVKTSLSAVEASLAVLLTFVLATLSWRYVERPFRNRSMKIGRVLVWVLCGCAVPAFVSMAILLYKGFPARFNEDAERVSAAVGSEYHCSVTEYIHFGNLHACPMFLPSRDPKDATVALVGNSHAQMYAPLVTGFLQANHQEGILVPLNRCLPMPDYNISPSCMASAAENLSAVEALPRIRIVILSMTWEHPGQMYTSTGLTTSGSKSKYLFESLDRLIQNLQQSGKTVVLVGPVKPPTWDAASVVARDMAFGHKITEPMFLPESTFLAEQGDVLAHYASRNDIIFIRPDRIQCKEGRCDFFRDGSALFADSSHIAEGALPLFRPVFDPGLQQAFIRANLPLTGSLPISAP